jgi:hypothetical protein
VNAKSLAISLKIAEWKCYNFAELSLECPAAGILKFSDETESATLCVSIDIDYVLRSLIKQEFWKVPTA